MIRETGFGISVVIELAHGKPLPFAVDSERAMVGSGAHCEIRLPRELAAREQLLLSASEMGAVRFEVQSHERATLRNGAPVSDGQLGPSDRLTIGALSLTATVVALGDPPRRFPLEALALVPALLVLALTLTLPSSTSASALPPRAPALFVDTPASCPSRDVVEAAQVAQQRHALAVARRERGPFSERDAVAAVSDFATAAACFHASADEAKARDDSAGGASLRRKLEEEYLTRRTRLEHAYVEGDTDAVDRELPALVGLTAHLQGPYVDWLTQETRRAEAATSQPRAHLL